jgi:hypothetical protein
MNKVEREIYLILSDECGMQLCGFCKYAQCAGSCCDDGMECHHPLHDKSGFPWENEDPEPGSDCWGFKPELTVEQAADICGAVISSGFDQWFFRRFKDGTIKVYGRKSEVES